jgi:hypothetical protein
VASYRGTTHLCSLLATCLCSLREGVCEALLFAAQPCLGQLGLSYFISSRLCAIYRFDSHLEWVKKLGENNLLLVLLCTSTLRVAAIELVATDSAWGNTGIALHGTAWRWMVGRSNPDYFRVSSSFFRRWQLDKGKYWEGI